MKNYWWKILGAVLMIYAFVAGSLIPLSPSIYSIDKQTTKSGESIELLVSGYNTNYSDNESAIKAWLRRDSLFSICASQISVLSQTKLKAAFDVPERVNTENGPTSFSLVVSAGDDGYSVLPSAISIVQDSTSASLEASCDLDGLANRKQQVTFPFRSILEETIRNLYYHVPLWFAMIILFFVSVLYSISYLRKGDLRADIVATEFVRVGVLYGILGLVTGAIWAKHTWGHYWNWDLRQNTAAISVLIYLAYLVLRDSFDDESKKARLSAVYNVFAFATLIPLMFVIPRLADSLHPGAGGNPAFGSNDLDNTMRMVFYPAIIGFTLVGVWMANLLIRVSKVRLKKLDDLET